MRVIIMSCRKIPDRKAVAAVVLFDDCDSSSALFSGYIQNILTSAKIAENHPVIRFRRRAAVDVMIYWPDICYFLFGTVTFQYVNSLGFYVDGGYFRY